MGMVAGLLLMPLAAPAVAQYAGNERGFVVSPLRVPSGGDLSGVGFGCSGASTVTITIAGEPGVFTTVIAEDDSSYQFNGVPIPVSLIIGDTYSAVASCDGVFETANFTVICANGDEPVGGTCPTSTPTTTAPANTPTTTSVTATNVGDPLAVTGADSILLIQIAATLVGFGALFLILGRRRQTKTA